MTGPSPTKNAALHAALAAAACAFTDAMALLLRFFGTTAVRHFLLVLFDASVAVTTTRYTRPSLVASRSARRRSTDGATFFASGDMSPFADVTSSSSL